MTSNHLQDQIELVQRGNEKCQYCSNKAVHIIESNPENHLVCKDHSPFFNVDGSSEFTVKQASAWEQYKKIVEAARANDLVEVEKLRSELQEGMHDGSVVLVLRAKEPAKQAQQ